MTAHWLAHPLPTHPTHPTPVLTRPLPTPDSDGTLDLDEFTQLIASYPEFLIQCEAIVHAREVGAPPGLSYLLHNSRVPSVQLQLHLQLPLKQRTGAHNPYLSSGYLTMRPVCFSLHTACLTLFLLMMPHITTVFLAGDALRARRFRRRRERV